MEITLTSVDISGGCILIRTVFVRVFFYFKMFREILSIEPRGIFGIVPVFVCSTFFVGQIIDDTL